MKLATRLVEKPWGRTDLPGWVQAPAGARIGEIWYEDAAGGELAVMVKYLFTSERLSIQVHPDDVQARAADRAHGKEEMWIILDAAPDATIGLGLRRKADADELRAAIASGEIEDLIDWRPVKAGDVIYNPAGTIHAAGAGLILLEIQQAIDLTYRLYDYGRPRELHLDAGLAVAVGKPHTDPRDGRLPGSGGKLLVTGPHFGVAWCDGTVPGGIPGDATEFQLVPVRGDAFIGDERLSPGDCGLAASPDAIRIPSGSQAVLAWRAGR